MIINPGLNSLKHFHCSNAVKIFPIAAMFVWKCNLIDLREVEFVFYYASAGCFNQKMVYISMSVF